MRHLAIVLVALAACSSTPGGTDACTIAGDVSRADRGLAQSACLRARQRFSAILGQAPAGTISLSATQGFSGYTQAGRWTLTWPTSARLGAGMGRTADATESRRFVEEQWREVLPHELGHVMLGAWLYSPGRDMAGEYGTYMPDWVDEAVAISMEPDTIRRERLSQARSFSPLPSVAEVLAFRHPLRGRADEAFSTRVLSSPPCEGPCDRERPADTRTITERIFRDGRVTVDTTWAAGEQRLDADPLARFYVLSYALWSYIEARGGRDAIATLIERLRRNPRDGAVLAGLPGLPRTPAAIDADWRGWLASGR